MKYSLLLCVLVTLLLFSSCNKADIAAEERQNALKAADALIQESQLDRAFITLDTTLNKVAGKPLLDSAYYLRGDLQEIVDYKLLQAHVASIEKAGAWQLVETNRYEADFFHFKSSMDWAKPRLLELRPVRPMSLAERKKKAAKDRKTAESQRRIQIQLAKEADRATSQEEVDKRVAAGAGMREIYLDAGQDVEVTITGKQKDVITLSYVLIGNVWSHRMNKDGNIDALLDLGFKKVILTDGYNYRTVWSRKG